VQLRNSLAERPQKFESLHLRHHDVGDQESDLQGVGKVCQGFFCRRSKHGLITVFFEIELQRFGADWLVLNNENE